MKPRCTNECAEDFKFLKKQNEELALAAVKISQRDDFRWLIEAPGLRYLAARKLGNYQFYWTVSHDDAIAFRSEAQADMTMMAIRDLAPELFAFERTLGNAKAIEHGWMDGPVSSHTGPRRNYERNRLEAIGGQSRD